MMLLLMVAAFAQHPFLQAWPKNCVAGPSAGVIVGSGLQSGREDRKAYTLKS